MCTRSSNRSGTSPFGYPFQKPFQLQVRGLRPSTSVTGAPRGIWAGPHLFGGETHPGPGVRCPDDVTDIEAVAAAARWVGSGRPKVDARETRRTVISR